MAFALVAAAARGFALRGPGARAPLRRLAAATAAADAGVAAQVEAQGALIRDLKEGRGLGNKSPEVVAAVAELVRLKALLEPPAAAADAPQKKQKQQKKKQKVDKGAATTASDSITSASEDFSAWYADVIRGADLVDASPVKGCMVIKPWGMAVWDRLRDELDGRIKASGAENAYFPLLIPRSFLAKEAEHVEGFAKECAVVTHHRLAADGKGGLEPDPAAELDEPLIIRPTSETMIWHMFGKWINSHRDLPLKINQWANVVRWEMRTRPFLRSSEFLWQEGHTAHATRDEALATAEEMLDVYAEVVEHFLAVPVVRGAKSAIERFAGADETYTIEALMPNGWALQSGTSHFLGQNFARAFDVQFQNKDAKRELVAVVPITRKNDDAGTKAVDALVDGLVAECKALGVRVKVDERPNMRPGAKFFEWERKGVPLRVEVGPRDAAEGVVVVASRLGGEKRSVAAADAAADLAASLEDIQARLFAAAAARLDGGTVDVGSYDELKAKIDADDLGFFRVYWAADDANEKAIKEDCSATIRCYPLDAQRDLAGKACFYSGKPATHVALFARAF
ncbi:synthetase [Aureococcus anophagefferens]|nr:synthetase [Aureococcus anophagefferens]